MYTIIGSKKYKAFWKIITLQGAEKFFLNNSIYVDTLKKK